MRKLLLPLLAVAILIAAACEGQSVYSGNHWARPADRAEMWIHVDMQDIANNTKEDKAIAGVLEWGKNNRVNVTVSRTCVVYVPCIPYTFPALSGGVAGLAYRSIGSDGHYVAGRIEHDINAAAEYDKNIGCHEFGHILGWDHNPNGHEGPCFGGVPSAQEMGDVSYVYEHTHGGSAASTFGVEEVTEEKIVTTYEDISG